MVQINWTIQAKNDLREIADYISKDSKSYAERQIFKIIQSTSILNTQMFSGREVPEFQDPTIREIIKGNYRVIYRILNDNRADIITVHHAARSLTSRKLILVNISSHLSTISTPFCTTAHTVGSQVLCQIVPLSRKRHS